MIDVLSEKLTGRLDSSLVSGDFNGPGKGLTVSVSIHSLVPGYVVRLLALSSC